MNPFVRAIGQGEIADSPDLNDSKLVVEDNIGESIHIHFRNTRLEFTIEEFIQFADAIEQASDELEQ
jgi:hypothetical protein